MEKGSNIESAEAAHEEARAKLAHLIDNPEKHLPVIDYIAHLQEAKRAVARTYKELQAAAHG